MKIEIINHDQECQIWIDDTPLRIDDVVNGVRIRAVQEFADKLIGCKPQELTMGTHACLDVYVNILDFLELLGGEYTDAAKRIRAGHKGKRHG